MPKVKYFDEEDVLNRIMRLFWSKGYAKTSLKDILDEVEIGKQSLYNSFGDKQSIFFHCLELYRTRSLEILEQMNSEEADFSDLENYFMKFHSAFSMESLEHKACMVGNTISSTMTSEDRHLVKFAKEYLELIERAFLNVLSNAKEKGQIRADIDLEEAALYLLNNGYGLGVLARAGYSESKLKSMVRFMLSSLK